MRLPVLLALLPAILVSCNKPGGQSAPPAVPVSVARVEIKNVPLEIQDIGTVEAYNIVSVNSRIGGELIKVYFEEGQDVKEGEPLFQIDPAPYRAALEGARANLERDSVRAWNAGETVKRYAELIGKEYITQQQYDDMLAESEALKATVRSDRAAVDNARLNFDYCFIRAPLAGRTGRLLVHQGNIIKANDIPLLVIHQIQPVYVRFTVPDQYLNQLLEYSRGGKLEVRAASTEDGQEINTGELSFVDNSVDQSTGTITLKALFPNANRLLWPGEFVNVSLVLKTIQGAVVLPSRAVQSGQNGDFVYIVGPDNTVESRPVTVSYSFKEQTVVEKGLDGGETVVTDGQLRLYPGAKIELTEGVGTGKAGSS